MAIIPSDQQIRTLSGDVDLTNRGNSLTQSQNEVYTMQDLVETVGGAGGGTTGPQGVPGVAGAAGAAGAQGVAGSDGTSINIKGTKNTVGDLPASGVLNDLWIIDQTGGGATAGDAYVWTAAGAWLNVGPLRGPQGVQGTAGTNGVDGAQGIQGIQGPVGAGNFLPLSGGTVTGLTSFTGSNTSISNLTPAKIEDSSGSTGTDGQVLKRFDVGGNETLRWEDSATVAALPYETIIIRLKQSGGSIFNQVQELNTTGTTGGTAYTVTTFQQTGNPLGSGVYAQIRDASNNNPSYEDVSVTQNSVRSSNAGVLGVTSYYSGSGGYVYLYWQDWGDQSAQNPSAGTSNATYLEIRIYK